MMIEKLEALAHEMECGQRFLAQSPVFCARALRELIAEVKVAAHPPEPSYDMQVIISSNGHPDEGPCVVCGEIFDTHLAGCVFAPPAEPSETTGLEVAACIVCGDDVWWPKGEPGPVHDKCKSAPATAHRDQTEAIARGGLAPAPDGGLRGLEQERDMHWKKRAYDTLAEYGVPFERAKSIANGIRVLAARYEKEIAALRPSTPAKETTNPASAETPRKDLTPGHKG